MHQCLFEEFYWNDTCKILTTRLKRGQVEQVYMAIHKIPVNKLSPEALQGVIEEFISRAGTDYGETEVPMETKFRQVKYKLENGLAILIFNDETETTNIFLANDPILKKLNELTG